MRKMMSVPNLEDILQSPPSDLEEKFGLMTKAGGKTEECWRKGAMIWRKGAVHIWGGRHGTRLPLKYGSNFDP